MIFVLNNQSISSVRQFSTIPNRLASDKIVSPSSFESIPQRSLLSKGIARSSDFSFEVPNINTKRNNDRYLLAVRILTSYFKNFLAQHVPASLETSLNRLLTTLGLYLQKSPATFCATVASHGTWFKAWLLSGFDGQGDISDYHWSVRANCPVLLEGIIKWLKENSSHTHYRDIIRLLITIFTLHKVIVVPTEPSLESITKQFTGTDQSGSFMDYNKVCQSLSISIDLVISEFKRLCSLNKFRESFSAGPNGSATWASHLDAYEIYNDPILNGIFDKICDATGQKFVTDMLYKINSQFLDVDFAHTEYTNNVHSKLHALFEKATKARIIAIGDYFSQTVLSPFHDMLANILKGIPADSTFDQNAGFKRLLNLTKGRKDVYSLDLSKATDRIPVLALSKMIAFLTGSEVIGKLWAALLTKRTFFTPTGHKVKYTVGQPMGFKSSFPAMALFHHMLLAQAAINCGKMGFDQYGILGDDIVIVGDDVAAEYQRLISMLGVDISLNKSVMPFSNEITGFEFCSRFGLNGLEYTPIPLTAVLETLSNFDSIVSLWDLLQVRDLFSGRDLWRFIAIFADKKQISFLILLNSLPSFVSGINSPVPLPLSGPALERQKSQGFTNEDITNLYLYNFITEVMIKLDTATKKAASWVGIINSEINTRPEEDNEVLIGTNLSLSALITDAIKKRPVSDAIHPIQEIVLNVSEKVAAVISLFNGTHLDPKTLADRNLLASINFDFGAKATYQSVHSSGLGDRRILSKTIKQLQKL